MNRFERAMEDPRWQTGEAGRFFAAASSSARRRLHQQADPRVEALTTVATSVAAPLVAAYVQWLLAQATRNGINRLYFLAREGQVIYRVARMFQAKWQLPIRLHYLFCSRKSLNHALLSTVSTEDMRWSLTHTQGYSLRLILSRVALCPEELSESLNDVGFTSSRWDAPLGSREQEILMAFLLRSDVAPLLEAKAQSAKVLIEDYLEQLEFFEDPLCGIVDAGGMGSQIRTLDKIKRARGGKGVKGFLIFRTHVPSSVAGGCPAIDTYFHDATSRDGEQPFLGLWKLIDMLCSADHGTVIGYKRRQGRVSPVLHMDRNATIRDWGIDRVQMSICAFAEAALEDSMPPKRFDHTNLSQLVERLMAMLWNDPAPEEAMAWGAFPWEQDATSLEVAMGAPIGWRDLIKITKGETWQEPIWWAASERRSSASIRATLRLARMVLRPVRRILRAYKT